MSIHRLSSAEQYTIVADKAYETSERFHNVRLNCMAVGGGSAIRLAEIGATFLDTSKLRHEYSEEDLFPDYVSIGARFSFIMMKDVIDQTARIVGPNNFLITPCDAGGNTLPDAEIEPRVGFNEIVRRNRHFWLGDEREDYWRSVSVGIAHEVVAIDIKPKKITRITETKVRDNAGYDAAYAALDLAAEHTLRAAQATRQANPGVMPLQSLHVKVESIAESLSIQGSPLHTLYQAQ